ncbi:MAG: SagB/ThcOx family dehydrogenase [Candidatus Coatesbacteria bacterium]|nr:MAG: SagB/ThcOx family dehydrogenase [Candidatus Coatesbacteria bacterium]
MKPVVIAALAALVCSAGCGAKVEENPPAESPPVEVAAETPAPDFRELPEASREGGLPLYEGLEARRSARTYGSRKLTEAEVGQLLWAGQGITSARGFRTAPSAGALYPMFLYYADDVALWRYDPRRHGLVKAVDGDVRRDLARAGLDQAPLKRAPGIIIVVAKPAISAAKYGGRAERYCMIEAGHIGQNILLTAEALGLGACPVGAFRDGELLDVMALGGEYLPLYLIPVGEAFEP